MKGSKWTWLRDKCIELGYYKSAKLAQEIENQLHQLYGVTDTKAWMEVGEDMIEADFYIDPSRIIANPAFCRACEESKRFNLRCSECAFAKQTRPCDVEGSLYLKFCLTFKKEHSKNDLNK